MNPLANILRPNPRAISSPVARAAISDMTYEVIPLKSLPEAIQQLPNNARVSVTASPVKPLEDTLDVCAELLDLGHRPIPHLAARKVTDASHMRSIAARIKQLGLSEIFCIAGDAQDAGEYPDAMSLLRPLLDITAGEISAVGVSSYPDGHAFIDDSALHQALIEKQELFEEAEVKGHASTQMCFSTNTIRSWLTTQRAEVSPCQSISESRAWSTGQSSFAWVCGWVWAPHCDTSKRTGPACSSFFLRLAMTPAISLTH